MASDDPLDKKVMTQKSFLTTFKVTNSEEF